MRITKEWKEAIVRYGRVSCSTKGRKPSVCYGNVYDSAVRRFLDKEVYSPGEPDLVFFEQSIQAKVNRSKLKIRKADTTFLQSAQVHKDLKKMKAVDPSVEGLDSRRLSNTEARYTYQGWQDAFEEQLFCTPRPIPKIISAEFDRQALFVSKLRAEIVEDDDDDDVLEFYGGDYDESPEVAVFAVFFFVYASFVGRDWQKYVDSQGDATLDPQQGCDERDASEEPIETVLPTFDRQGRDVALLSSCGIDTSLCSPCAQSGFDSMQSTLVYIGQEAGDAYTSLFENTARSAGNTGAIHSDPVAELEEAKEVASAQLDLAYEVLSSMKLRGPSVDSDAYLSLMEACGRCGDTERALQLI